MSPSIPILHSCLQDIATSGHDKAEGRLASDAAPFPDDYFDLLVLLHSVPDPPVALLLAIVIIVGI